MSRLYEGMFLIDNDAVRADWASAKANVTDLIAKHGGQVHTARRWDERRLAYTVKKKNRATFLRAYYEIDSDGIPPFLRDLEINEKVLRYLTLSAEAVPTEETEAAQAEDGADFSVPEPPADDALDPEPILVPDPDDEDGPSRPRSAAPAAANEEPATEEPAKEEAAAEPAAAEAGETKADDGGEG